MQAVQQMPKALLATPDAPIAPKAELIVSVARDFGVGPMKQMTQILPRLFGKNQLSSAEYYAAGLYDKKYSAEERMQFVGHHGSYRLNKSMTPIHTSTLRGLMQSKTQFGTYMEACGLQTTKTQAVVSATGSFGPVPALRDAGAVANFLRDAKTSYPLFGKPCVGSRSIGSALVERFDAKNDTVILGNGNIHAVDDFANEVSDDFPLGYMFQEAVEQHPEMTAMVGQAVGSIRIVTVNDGTGAKVLYAVWKMPSPDAMSDNFWQAGSMLAKVDEETGKTVQCIRGTGPAAAQITEHPVSGLPTVGFQIPYWEEAKALAIETHNNLLYMGVVGFDMGVMKDGPVVIEANDNPFHTIYQLATGEGIHNEKFSPIFESVIANQAKMEAMRKKADLI